MRRKMDSSEWKWCRYNFLGKGFFFFFFYHFRTKTVAPHNKEHVTYYCCSTRWHGGRHRRWGSSSDILYIYIGRRGGDNPLNKYLLRNDAVHRTHARAPRTSYFYSNYCSSSPAKAAAADSRGRRRRSGT